MVDLQSWDQRGLFSRRPADLTGAAHFYHTMDVPGRGLVTGLWDLRAGLEPYLGHVDYAGCTVLEIGPSSGFITFTLERRGATMIAVDLPVEGERDLFPVSAKAVADHRRSEAPHRRAARNAFWIAHQAFDSQARLVEASVDDLDPGLTGFDVAIVCNVMQHRRDPVGMLLDIADRATTIVVTEADWLGGTNDSQPVMQLVTPSLRAGGLYSWFVVSPQLVEDILTLKGFAIVARDAHHQPFTPEPSEPTQHVLHYTITATRTTR